VSAQVKTKQYKTYKNIMKPKKNTKRQNRGPTGLIELFLLTVSIEEVARWQYETVLTLL